MKKMCILFILSAISYADLPFADLPECHPDYDEWVSVGSPVSWCYPRQCKGDSDGYSQLGRSVSCNDMTRLQQAFKVKEPPYGTGVLSNGGIAADFDHRLVASPYVGCYRVGTTDLCIFRQYFQVITEEVNPDCGLCTSQGSGLDGPMLSIKVNTGNGFRDADTVGVFPNTHLTIGIQNNSTDKAKFYDAYLGISAGFDNGSWTGNTWILDSDCMNWNYFGRTVSSHDMWYAETLPYAVNCNVNTIISNSVSSSVEYEYNGPGEVTIELFDEFADRVIDTLTIQTLVLSVAAPNGNEHIAYGRSYEILWDSDSTIPSVDIDCSLDNGLIWQTIVQDVNNTGAYTWDTVPPADSNECLIRITDSTDPQHFDISDQPFVIFECAGNPVPKDYNDDCHVNTEDLWIFSTYWLADQNPYNETFDLHNFSLLAQNWLACGDPFDAQCTY